MPSFTNHRVQIYSLTTLAHIGTITRVITAEGVNEIDAVGSGSFQIHGSDTPSVSLIQEFRIARVIATSVVSGQVHEVACFIIRDVHKEGKGNKVIYTVKGPDLIGELMFGNIGFAVISNNAGGPSLTPIADALLNSNKIWSITQHGTGHPDGGIFVGSGETTFVVLITLLQQLRGHMSFSLKNNPRFHVHIWYEHTKTFGADFDTLTLLETTNPQAYANNPAVAIITTPVVVTPEKQEVFTRAYIFGAGMGVDRQTIKPAQGHVTIPAGFTVDFDKSLIVNSALEAIQPKIATSKGFPEYEPEDPNDDFSVRVNAMSLFSAGYYWLKNRSKSVILFYEVKDLVIHRDILPGQLIHITYSRTSPVNSSGTPATTPIINLDDDLIVLSVRHRFGEGGIRYTDLVIGDTPKRPSTGLDWISEKLKELEETIKHTDAGSGGSGSPSGSSSYLLATGSGPILSGNLLVEPLITIDGVDISAHADDPDAHHVPGTLSHNSPNFNNGTETHAIDASSNPGSQAYLLKTGPGGQLTLMRADLGNLVLTDRTTAQPFNIFINDGRMFIEPI